MRSSTMDVGARWTDGTARWRTMDLEAMDRHLNQQRTTFDNPLRASLYGFVLQQIRKAVRRPSHRYRDPRRCHRESVLSSTPTSNPIHSTIARAQSAWVSGQLIHNPVATPYAGRTVRRAVYDLHPQSSAYGMSELVESYKCARSKSPRARSLCGSPPWGLTEEDRTPSRTSQLPPAAPNDRAPHRDAGRAPDLYRAHSGVLSSERPDTARQGSIGQARGRPDWRQSWLTRGQSSPSGGPRLSQSTLCRAIFRI